MATVGAALAEAARITWEDPTRDWFPPARTTVEALDSAAAAASAGAGLNPPWSVLRHLDIGFAIWRGWLAGEQPDMAALGAGHEWEAIADASPAAWSALLAAASAHEAEFRDFVARQPDEWYAEVPPAVGVSRFELVLSLVLHTAYHAGELATLATAADRRS